MQSNACFQIGLALGSIRSALMKYQSRDLSAHDTVAAIDKQVAKLIQRLAIEDATIDYDEMLADGFREAIALA